MIIDWVTVMIAVCFGLYGLYQIMDKAIVPMFNAYLQYKLQVKEMETLDVKGLQRDFNESDSSSEIGESDNRPPIHDERL